MQNTKLFFFFKDRLDVLPTFVIVTVLEEKLGGLAVIDTWFDESCAPGVEVLICQSTMLTAFSPVP